jgi:hypothetical protein
MSKSVWDSEIVMKFQTGYTKKWQNATNTCHLLEWHSFLPTNPCKTPESGFCQRRTAVDKPVHQKIIDFDQAWNYGKSKKVLILTMKLWKMVEKSQHSSNSGQNLHSPRSGFARPQDSTRINHCHDSANSGCFVERGRCDRRWTQHAKIPSGVITDIRHIWIIAE